MPTAHIYDLGVNRFQIHVTATPMGISEVAYEAALFHVIDRDTVERIDTDGEEFDSGSESTTVNRARIWLERKFGKKLGGVPEP
jgi:hypothetical protein